VQRAGDRVRVTAQLIDARTDAHLWAQQYDGDVADVLGFQSEIAQKIVGQLKAALSPGEQTALAATATQDPEAYDLYLRARQLHRDGGTGSMAGVNALEQIKVLDQAVARDAAFVPALCMLAQAHLRVFWFKQDHTPGRLDLARAALDAAARLQPQAGEVHLTRALFHYWGSRAYGPALAELALAGQSLPNDVDVLFYIGAIERRQGRWEESARALQRALELDPRNSNTALDLSWTYRHLRRYDDARWLIDSVLKWKAEDMTFQFIRADIDLLESGDLTRLRQVLSREMPPKADPNLIAIYRHRLALFERNYRAAEEALSAYRLPEITSLGFSTPVEYYQGLAASGLGDAARAEDAFRRARERAAALVAARPGDAKALMILAKADAKVGRKEEAVRGAERAIELLPVAADTFDGPLVLGRLAEVYAEVGETDRALEVLQQAAALPGGAAYGVLKLGEEFDAVRNDARFETIVASLAPKSGG
jgi:tetratricopeptide (TPR) repeat protein